MSLYLQYSNKILLHCTTLYVYCTCIYTVRMGSWYILLCMCMVSVHIHVHVHVCTCLKSAQIAICMYSTYKYILECTLVFIQEYIPRCTYKPKCTHVHVRVKVHFLSLFLSVSVGACSVETDIPSERGSPPQTIPIGARQAPQSAALPSQGVCIRNVITQVHVHACTCIYCRKLSRTHSMKVLSANFHVIGPSPYY